jgi:mono/diheme cytochrome c family protein
MPDGPTPPVSVQDDWDRIAAYVQTVRSPRAPTNLNKADVTAGRELFVSNNCAGCHGTDMWTISRVFYTPNEENNAANGKLRSSTYSADAAFPAGLNPPSAGTDRKAPLRFVGANAADNAANDQINCVLRAVGTFPETPDASQSGVAPQGVLVREVRQNMSTLAQGATGFNPPSLLGMVSGAPYFHAGNARTLEELFDPTFAAHSTAFSSNFPGTGDRATRVGQLVQFLLSVDEESDAVDVPQSLGFDPELCPPRFP